MKKYVANYLKWIGVLSLISILVFAIGIVLFLFSELSYEIPLSLTFVGGIFGFFLTMAYFSQKSRVLTLDEEKVVLPRGAYINEKLSFSKTSIKKSGICCVERTFFKGDKIISEDTYFYTVKLKDGTKVTFPLYEYGKKAEEEIFGLLKGYVS